MGVLGKPSLWEEAKVPPFCPSSKDLFKEEEEKLWILFHNLCLDLSWIFYLLFNAMLPWAR